MLQTEISGKFVKVYFSCFSHFIFRTSAMSFSLPSHDILHLKSFTDPGLQEIGHHSSICR